MRIEHRQPRRHTVFQIGRGRHESVGDPLVEREGIDGRRRPERDWARNHRAGKHGKEEERDLLDGELPDRDPALAAPPESPKRPEVEEQQDKRQRHEHRLRHQAEREESKRSRVPTYDSAPDVRRISHEGEQHEERAEDVLAFGDPGDRFDVQRMNTESAAASAPCRSVNFRTPEDAEY
jgi:hypothetical protein